jgi:hypothetical protein
MSVILAIQEAEKEKIIAGGQPMQSLQNPISINKPSMVVVPCNLNYTEEIGRRWSWSKMTNGKYKTLLPKK